MRPVILIIATLATCLALPTNHSNVKIFGGKTAEPGQFPFIVAINFTDEARVICAGSVIHENWILTTATCSGMGNLKANQLVVTSGTNQLDTGAGVVYNVSQIVLHPNFTLANLQENIALYQINGSFTFSDLVQPITLGHVSANDSVIAAGWGFTETIYNPALQYAEVTAWSNEDCIAALKKTGFDSIIGPGEVCTFASEGVGICEADVGAPLVLDGTLVGLGAWAVLRCGGGYPDIFTRVSVYKDWIDNVIRS